MSLILLEGWDDGLRFSRWINEGGATFFSSVGGSSRNRFGNVLPWSSGLHQGMKHTWPIAADHHATMTLGMWMYVSRIPTSATSRHLVNFLNGGTYHVSMHITTQGKLEVRLSTGTFLGITDNVIFSAGSTHYLEIQVFVHDTTGTVTVWVDGNVVIALTNVDTRNGASEVIDAVSFRNLKDTQGGLDGECDDIYVTNGDGPAPYNGRLGDLVVETLFPNDNGFYSDFVGSDADSVDNYLHVDETTHDSDSTYVESGVGGARDSYKFQDLSTTTEQVRGVMITTVVRNTGVADDFQITTRIDSNDYDSDTITAPAGYEGKLQQILQLSPDTGVNWTAAELNATEFGIENVV